MPDALAFFSSLAELGVAGWCLRLALGAVVGFLIGLTGVGGGSMVIPALVLGLGLNVEVAVATANLFSFLTKISAVLTHWRLRTIDWRATGIFLIGAVPGTVLASWAVKNYVTDGAAREFLLWLVFAVVVVSIVLLALMKPAEAATISGGKATPPAPPAPASPRRRVTGILAGVLVGLVIGATSVGGGVVVIPLLALCFGLPMTRIVGSSIAIALALTLTASIAYWSIPSGRTESLVDLPTTLLMALGAIGGVIGGSLLGKRIGDERLRWMVLAVMVIAAGLLAYKNLG